MNVTYTNRKGVTYYLCRGTTKTNRAHYYFAREPKGEPVEEIPEGYEIRESVNGFVTLAKVRPRQILPEEEAAVEAALRRHPKSGNYRVDVKGKQIVIHERTGTDLEELVSRLGQVIPLAPRQIGGLQETLDRRARFVPVLRFTLRDEAKRTFYAERWCYLGSIDDWIDVGSAGPLRRLARKLIPKLGTDAFFEIY